MRVISPFGLPALLPLLTAVVFTSLNALKPVHLDDATFYAKASQVARHPADPYGFTLMRWDEPVPANHALAPPVLPYWWAAAIRLFGDNVVLWKLWLLPFAAVLSFSLWHLLGRFAPRFEGPLLLIVFFGPAFLPAFNLMMDVPAIALSLAALALFCLAADRGSLPLAVLSGLAVGLAMETKYTAFVTPAVLCAYSLVFRRFRLGFAAVSSAVLVFVAWETFIALRYGESHFLYQLQHGDNGEVPRTVLLLGLFPLLGAVAPAITLLAAVGLGLPRWTMLALAALGLLPYLVLVWPDGVGLRGMTAASNAAAGVLFSVSGIAVLLGTTITAWRFYRTRDISRKEGVSATPSVEVFLILWLGLELAGYLFISPFPAARRVMCLLVPATCVVGCLAARTRPSSARGPAVGGAVLATVVLGLFYFVVDYREARAEQEAARSAAGWIRQRDAGASIWFTGYWGFQFYAQQQGMKQAVPMHRPVDPRVTDVPTSQFRRGDWLVIPSANVAQQTLYLDRSRLVLMQRLSFADSVPFRTLDDYYARTVPVRRHSGPRLVVLLFQLRDDLVPMPPP